MKLCITSYGPTLDSRVQPIFGRCAYFIFVNPADMSSQVKPNPYVSASDKAGVESARLIINEGVGAVLTGRVGAKAREVLDAAGITVIELEGETVREAMEGYGQRRRDA